MRGEQVEQFAAGVAEGHLLLEVALLLRRDLLAVAVGDVERLAE